MNNNVKSGKYDEQGQPRFMKRAPNQDSSNASKGNKNRGSGSKFAKPTFHNFRKKHFGKCLAGTSGCYGCGKNYYQVKNCPTRMVRGREDKKASFNGPNLDSSKEDSFLCSSSKRGQGS